MYTYISYIATLLSRIHIREKSRQYSGYSFLCRLTSAYMVVVPQKPNHKKKILSSFLYSDNADIMLYSDC